VSPGLVDRRGLGWKRDPPLPFGAKPHPDARLTLGTASPPETGSGRQWVQSVLDQGQASTCVAHSIPQNVRMAHARAGIRDPQLMSRRMGYWYARGEDGTQNVDEGTYLSSFFKALDQVGFCPESLCPYDISKINQQPPAAAVRAAYDQRSPTVYQRITTAGQARVDDIKRAIAAGYGVSFGTLVTEDFCSNVLSDGPIPVPTADQQIAGGHALIGVEYDPRGVKGPNSWGESWGDDGWFNFSWDYMVWDETTDLWIVAQAPNYSE